MGEEQTHETMHDLVSRRRFMQIAAVATGGTVLAACGGSTITQPAKLTVAPTMPPQSVAATVTAAVGKTYFPSGDPNVANAYTAPIPLSQSVFHVPGNGDAVNSFAITTQPAVTAKSSNKYWQELEKHLNVTWNSTLVTSDVYPEKVGTVLA